MARRQCDHLPTFAAEVRIRADDECTNQLSRHRHEYRFKVAFAAGAEDLNALSEGTSRGLHVFQLEFRCRTVWIHEDRYDGRLWNQLAQQTQPLRRKDA